METEEEKKEEVVDTSNKVTKPIITKEQELEIYKKLAFKSLKEVGYEYGLQHYYKKDAQVRTAILNIANRIRRAPELYGITQDVCDVIDEAVSSRSIKQNPSQTFVKEIEQNEFKDKLELVRDRAVEILNKKLEKISKQKDMGDIKLKEIADVLSMAIDKYRLVRGESTDNIIHYSKVDLNNISPEQALQLVLRARDAVIDNKK